MGWTGCFPGGVVCKDLPAKKQEKQSMEAKTQSAAPVLTAIGVDIGKDVFHIVGFSSDAKIALLRKIKPCGDIQENCRPASLAWKPASARIS